MIGVASFLPSNLIIYVENSEAVSIVQRHSTSARGNYPAGGFDVRTG